MFFHILENDLSLTYGTNYFKMKKLLIIIYLIIPIIINILSLIFEKPDQTIISSKKSILNMISKNSYLITVLFTMLNNKFNVVKYRLFRIIKKFKNNNY